MRSVNLEKREIKQVLQPQVSFLKRKKCGLLNWFANELLWGALFPVGPGLDRNAVYCTDESLEDSLMEKRGGGKGSLSN